MKIHLKKLCTALSKIKAATTAFLLLLGCLAVPKPTFAGTYTELVNFTNMTAPFFGRTPTSVVTLSADGTTLYGTTPFGGVNNHGVIFSYDIATGMYTDLFDFTGATGANPQRRTGPLRKHPLWDGTDRGCKHRWSDIFL